MPKDELGTLLLEAIPPVDQESSQGVSELLDSLRAVVATVGQVPDLSRTGLGPAQPPMIGPAQSDPLGPLLSGGAVLSEVVNTSRQAGGVSLQPENTLGGIVSTLMGTGFSVLPLLSSIASLFGGDAPSPSPPLPKYVPAAAIDYEGSVLSSNPDAIFGVDYDANGVPRTNGRVPDFPSAPAAATGWQTEPPVPQTAMASANPQITIQVQTMDSRSFLDHSDEIARAVKEAILNSSSLNDVFSEL